MAIVLVAGSFDALIFDCDGTLVDTAPAHFGALRLALERVGRTIESDWYFERVGLTPTALLDAYERQYGDLPVSRADLLRPYATAFQNSIEELREITLVAEIARTWHSRVPLAVASNGQAAIVRSSLRSVGLLGLFDHVIAIEDVANGKPAPDIFLEAASRMLVLPERCIVLEDSDEGLAGAHAAAMQTIDIRQIWTPSWKK